MYTPYEYGRAKGRPVYALASTQGILRTQRGVREGLPRVFQGLDEARCTAEKLNTTDKTNEERTAPMPQQPIRWTIPLTPCDPNRRRVTAEDVRIAGAVLLVRAHSMGQHARFVRDTDRRADEATQGFGERDRFTVDARSTASLARQGARRSARRGYAQTLEMHAQMYVGAYLF